MNACNINVVLTGDQEEWDGYLKVSVGQDIGRAVEILQLLEGRHDLLPHHAPLLVHQLDGRSLTVMGDTVPHHHVELVLIVLHAQHHGHGLTNLDYTADFTGVGSLANLHGSHFTGGSKAERCDGQMIDNEIMRVRHVNRSRRVSWHNHFISS